MEEILINREIKICWNCDFRAKTAERLCPQCRRELRTEFEIQKRGIYDIFIGIIFITIGLIVLAIYNPFSGDFFFFDLMFAVLDIGLMMFWGFPPFIGGLWQYVTGKNGEHITKAVGYFSWVVTFAFAVYLFFSF